MRFSGNMERSPKTRDKVLPEARITSQKPRILFQ
jgi:hypothetical protein